MEIFNRRHFLVVLLIGLFLIFIGSNQLTASSLVHFGEPALKIYSLTESDESFYLAIEDFPPLEEVKVTFIREDGSEIITQNFVTDKKGRLAVNMDIKHPLPHGKYSVRVEMLGTQVEESFWIEDEVAEPERD